MPISLQVQSHHKRRSSFKHLFGWMIIIAVVWYGGDKIFIEANNFWQERSAMAQVASVYVPPPVIPDEELYDVESYTIIDGDTGLKILQKLGFTDPEAFNVIEQSKDIYDLNLVKVDDELMIYYEPGTKTFKKLKYELNSYEIYTIAKNGSKFDIYIEDIKYHTSLKTASGIIEESLYKNAVMDQGLSPKLVVDLADIFAWDVDFSTDIRVGDSFKVYYEEKKRKDKPEKIITGNILAAEFTNDGKTFQAFYFAHEDLDGYFDYDGNAIEKQFLRSPIQYKYISSGYTESRFHPILKKYLPHRSIDYVAPYGTPVVTIGDGTVSYVGWNGGWGMTVKVKHNENYITQYGHLSKYADGITYGAKVSQGDTVGYVGMTGYTTGPHLDFTFYKNGSPVDPFKIEFPSGDPIPEDLMAGFYEKRDVLAKFLD